MTNGEEREQASRAATQEERGDSTNPTPTKNSAMVIAADPPEWPQYFPTACPPITAPDADGAVYRFVKRNPPEPADMLSWLERGLGNGSDCQRAALSCFITREDAEEVRRVTPRRKRHYIATVSLRPEHGKLKQTGAPAHHSLWLRLKYRVTAHELFEVIS